LAIADGNGQGVDDALRGLEIDLGSDLAPLDGPVQHVADYLTQ
jgi:hypothetical protein